MAQRYGIYMKCYGSIVRILYYLRTIVRIIGIIRTNERACSPIIERKCARKEW